MQAPVLGLRLLVAQAFERNAHFDLVAPVGEPALRLKHEVGREVRRFTPRGESREVAARGPRTEAFDQGAIGLHAKRIHGQGNGLAAVVERGQEECDGVFGVELVPLRQARSHTSGGSLRAHPKEDRRGRVEDQDLGLLFRWTSIVRRVLREVREPRGLRPRRIVEAPIDVDALVEPRHRDLQLVLASGIPERVRAFEQSGREEQGKGDHSGLLVPEGERGGAAIL